MTQAWSEPPRLAEERSGDPKSIRAWTLAGTFKKRCSPCSGAAWLWFGRQELQGHPSYRMGEPAWSKANTETAELSCWIWSTWIQLNLKLVTGAPHLYHATNPHTHVHCLLFLSKPI